MEIGFCGEFFTQRVKNTACKRNLFLAIVISVSLDEQLSISKKNKTEQNDDQQTNKQSIDTQTEKDLKESNTEYPAVKNRLEDRMLARSLLRCCSIGQLDGKLSTMRSSMAAIGNVTTRSIASDFAEQMKSYETKMYLPNSSTVIIRLDGSSFRLVAFDVNRC